MRIGSRWWYRPNLPMPTPSLRLTCPYRETCCENTSRNSRNFLKIRNWPNYAPTLVFSKNVDKRQYFITLDEEGPDEKKTSCREYTLPRDQETSRARGWIRGNAKTEPVLDVKVCYHQRRYGVDIMIESLFRGPNSFLGSRRERNQQYVTETSEEIPVESLELVRAGKLVAKAEPRPKPAVTLSLISIPIRERKWIDIDTQPLDQSCFAVSKFMIRLLRHEETTPREDDGAVRCDDLIEKFKVKFVGISQWTVKNTRRFSWKPHWQEIYHVFTVEFTSGMRLKIWYLHREEW